MNAATTSLPTADRNRRCDLARIRGRVAGLIARNIDIWVAGLAIVIPLLPGGEGFQMACEAA